MTRVARVLADGRLLIATSRRHRKGLALHEVAAPDAGRIAPTRARAWSHWWAPGRLGWWVAAVFMVGSAHFMVGGWAATWPAVAPAVLRSAAVLNGVFFVGSLFFTGAAYLQLLEATNGHSVRTAQQVRGSFGAGEGDVRV